MSKEGLFLWIITESRVKKRTFFELICHITITAKLCLLGWKVTLLSMPAASHHLCITRSHCPKVVILKMRSEEAALPRSGIHSSADLLSGTVTCLPVFFMAFSVITLPRSVCLTALQVNVLTSEKRRPT